MRKSITVASSILAMAVLIPASALANVLPPGSHAFGKTYGAWSAAWWQYVLSQPLASNPLGDTTGADCRIGQSGPVFFLAGGLNSTSVTRDECTVPAGKALFFPLTNATEWEGSTPLQSWERLEKGFGPITALHASIDGRAVGNLDPATTPFRVCAGPVAQCSAPSFSFFLPAENLVGSPEGTYQPAVDDGVYLLLTPLRPGPHTINFGGSAIASGSEFSEEITYHLTVSPS